MNTDTPFTQPEANQPAAHAGLHDPDPDAWLRPGRGSHPQGGLLDLWRRRRRRPLVVPALGQHRGRRDHPPIRGWLW